MKAHLRKYRISSKKTNIVAGLIRGRMVEEALAMLKLTPNKAATPLYKCLASAVANAENNDGKDRENLLVDQVIINKGASYRRFKPGPRGRAMRLRKPTTHITIFLSDITSS